MGISFNFSFTSCKICNWKKIYHVVVVNFKSQFLLEEDKYTTCFCHESDFKNNSVVSMTDQKKIRPSKEQIDLIHIDKKHVDLITAITNIKKK